MVVLRLRREDRRNRHRLRQGLTQLKTVSGLSSQGRQESAVSPLGRPALLGPSELGAQTPRWR